jgi:hypothetical protein
MQGDGRNGANTEQVDCSAGHRELEDAREMFHLLVTTATDANLSRP